MSRIILFVSFTYLLIDDDTVHSHNTRYHRVRVVNKLKKGSPESGNEEFSSRYDTQEEENILKGCLMLTK